MFNQTSASTCSVESTEQVCNITVIHCGTINHSNVIHCGTINHSTAIHCGTINHSTVIHCGTINHSTVIHCGTINQGTVNRCAENHGVVYQLWHILLNITALWRAAPKPPCWNERHWNCVSEWEVTHSRKAVSLPVLPAHKRCWGLVSPRWRSCLSCL